MNNGLDTGASRDAQLVAQYLEGNISLRQLGRQHQMSAERCRQIIAASGVRPTRIAKARKTVQERQRKEKECQRRYGVSLSIFEQLRDIDTGLRCEGIELTLIRCYERDKRKAKRQGVRWELNLQQYAWLFEDFGKFDRGTIAKPECQLGRLDEADGFTYSNTVLDTVRPKLLHIAAAA